MPLYHHVRDGQGGTRMVLVETDSDVPTIEAPPQPEVESAKLTNVWRCKLCSTAIEPVDFAIPALGAKHFHNTHAEIDGDKDSWRAHIEKVSIEC